MLSLYPCTLIFTIDNDPLGHAIKIKAHGIIGTYK